MTGTTRELSPIQWHEYRSRALQFLNGLKFPATKEAILAHYTRKNTPMELLEETMALQPGTFASAAEFADVITASHASRPPHTWVSREIRD
jgi:hypothetical protein